jgi:DNA-binding transcriptional MerR regulator
VFGGGILVQQIDFIWILYLVLSITMNIDVVSAKRAAAICGFETVAMIDYLERSELFIPNRPRRKGHGKRREYDFRDLVILKTISTLLKNGASVMVLKKSLQEFQKSKWKSDRATLENENGALKYFMVSGSGILFSKSEASLFDLTKGGQMAFSFIIDLDKIHTELCVTVDQGELKLKV